MSDPQNTGAVVTDQPKPEPGRGLPEAPPGVRDPWKGLRGIMAGTLVLEFITFMLALPVVGKLGGGVSSIGFIIVTVLSVLMLVAAFVQRRPWGLGVALALQVAMILCAFVHLAVGVMGVIFAAVWGYLLYLRRDVARRMREGQLYDQLGHPPGYPPEQTD
ncbi:DUF4233 domain-containing protein [Saccharopolyspora phatthalungensis]|uniref:DUF4233 domain-containing protein n=1 Tax=Saccharopolyspora phatthalungensis TaxID=664693 RepID=A0A840PZ67_9PSEU|nr:DUF4233 domain-containing protein [Saccharopolyspora phatthalungensis]MBB5153057.1 hypothetical protein [Saccharopolyspora phatthalungensis]